MHATYFIYYENCVIRLTEQPFKFISREKFVSVYREQYPKVQLVLLQQST